MIHTDKRFSRAVEETVARIETTTDAELIVVAANRSGSYRDLTYLGAAGASMAMLGFIVLAPFVFHPWLTLIELCIVYFVFAWLLDTRALLRLMSTAARRDAQVLQAAEAEFHHESVHATPNRTGVLIYVSALEGQVKVLPDVGVEGRIPPGRWHAAVAHFAHDDLDEFLAGLEAVGGLLAEHVPKLEEDLIDLPNAPRIRS